MKASIEKFAESIVLEMEAWSSEVEKTMKEEIDRTANESLNAIKNHLTFQDRTGKYRKGFRKKVVANGMGFKRIRIYNTVYQIGHLLENGHLNRDGSRARAFPHWKYGQMEADKLPQRMEEALKK